MRLVAPFLLVVLLLAGCLMPAGDGEAQPPGTTRTGLPPTGTPSETGTPADPFPPEGWTEAPANASAPELRMAARLVQQSRNARHRVV